jgi:HK97 family phage major capsid protein
MPDIAQLRQTLEARRGPVVRQMRDLLDEVQRANRSDLTLEEQARYDSLRREVSQLDDRISELADQESREAVAAGAHVRRGNGSGVQVIREEQTYRPDDAQRGVSFLRDVMNQTRDPGAASRLQRHSAEADVIYSEYRAGNTGNYAGLVVPQYLTDLVAPARRAGRPVADICNGHPLPPDGLTVNISRITTGSTVAAQTPENTQVSNTDIDDTLLSVNVRTYAGQQDLSRQAVDRGVGTDEIVIADLARAYNTSLDDGILNADGTAGTHLGIRSTPGIIAVTYVDGTPTTAELYPKLFDLVQQVQNGSFMGLSHLVMNPRRWWWAASQVGTSVPFLQLASAPQGAAGTVLGTGTYEKGLAGILSTIGVVLDANMKTNLGAGTEDVILGVTADELHLWEDPQAPLLIRTDEAVANALTVRFVVYGYTAFTAGRYPTACGTISGTGLIAPTF